jgi:hypothetical protein
MTRRRNSTSKRIHFLLPKLNDWNKADVNGSVFIMLCPPFEVLVRIFAGLFHIDCYRWWPAKDVGTIRNDRNGPNCIRSTPIQNGWNFPMIENFVDRT